MSEETKSAQRIIVNGEEKPPAKKIRASDIGLDIEAAIREALAARKK